LRLTDSFRSPENYTRDGITYPSRLAGIAGYVSTLSSTLLGQSSSGALKLATTDTIVTTCIPRTVVTVECKDNLEGTGMSWNNLGKSDTSGFMDTQQAQFCGRNRGCGNVTQRPDYTAGSVFVVSRGSVPSCWVAALIKNSPGPPVHGRLLRERRSGKRAAIGARQISRLTTRNTTATASCHRCYGRLCSTDGNEQHLLSCQQCRDHGAHPDPRQRSAEFQPHSVRSVSFSHA
jgi:hypothetical protein